MSFQFYESRVFAAILHLICIGQLLYAMHFDWNLNIPDTPGVPKMLRHGFGGRSRFLTYWCIVSFVCEVLKIFRRIHRIILTASKAIRAINNRPLIKLDGISCHRRKAALEL